MNNEKKTMKNLKKIVKERNMSLTALSVDLEVSQEAISQYISGKIKPKTSTIIEMAKILNTSTDYLLDLTNDPKPSNFNIDDDEIHLLLNYKKLSKENKIKLKGYLQALIDIEKI